MCIRMFPRRCFVYSSLGRDPTTISLKPYISRLLTCSTIEKTVLQNVDQEQLEYFLKIQTQLQQYPP